MAQVTAEVVVPVPPDVAFAVSQTTGATRYRWDPFVHEQHFLDGAPAPGKGVRTATTSRHRLRMVSEYVSWAPGSHVGMRMTAGPWFFEVFAGSWRFTPAGDGGTRAVWRYVFRCRPRWAAPLVERVGEVVLGRDIRRRIAGFAAGCADPVVLAAVQRP
ncbi:hypothetical protein GCM10011381_13810 [Klenkia taihuensis]|uniref:Polyketide cyclase / dehydrase and lipid transport n=1 Tax=Klenkia taihuensis TaxID=1225127 RepID=A0A1I1H666_9ACTN|nr:hypothetical protein GCM10011381_13810 [Klenkia taihuensis]SFC19679.1 Polyketide cyclase / dehydrase and lipid transport [Klenkia taihuensis]